MGSYFGVLLRFFTEDIEFRAADRQAASGGHRRGTLAPGAHDEDGGGKSQSKCQEGHDPGHPLATGGGGRGNCDGDGFLDKALEYEVVIIAACEDDNNLVA